MKEDVHRDRGHKEAIEEDKHTAQAMTEQELAQPHEHREHNDHPHDIIVPSLFPTRLAKQSRRRRHFIWGETPFRRLSLDRDVPDLHIIMLGDLILFITLIINAGAILNFKLYVHV
jgi:hypothetical protein